MLSEYDIISVYSNPKIILIYTITFLSLYSLYKSSISYFKREDCSLCTTTAFLSLASSILNHYLKDNYSCENYVTEVVLPATLPPAAL